ncbi:MAG: hypothetical protein K2W82_06895 [Candidatus Obscuribacterales bacterium]|nr:hypothetical protein [Candidatus Obscuribacterales bacterium]
MKSVAVKNLSSKRIAPVLCCLIFAANSVGPVLAADSSQVNFKIFTPPAQATTDSATTKPAEGDATESLWSDNNSTAETTPAPQSSEQPAAAPATAESSAPAETTVETKPATSENSEKPAEEGKLLQGYIRVVPSGTKVPIIMDSAVDSDTSQEGDEFAARTSEDLNIDGSTIVPAGSVIKGRIAQLNSPKHLSRSGSVALKFDTITTPDNRQIALVANLVARGGVVHAKRGLKDIAIDTGTLALPTVLGVGIGALAGGANNSSSNIGRGGGALIGAAVGVAIGVVILCAKKGKKVDVRPGDELKIELAEDLRMPM